MDSKVDAAREVNGLMADDLPQWAMRVTEWLAALNPKWVEDQSLGKHWKCRVWGDQEWIMHLVALLHSNGFVPRPRGTTLYLS